MKNLIPKLFTLSGIAFILLSVCKLYNSIRSLNSISTGIIGGAGKPTLRFLVMKNDLHILLGIGVILLISGSILLVKKKKKK